MAVRVLTPRDAEAFRELRLEALFRASFAFGAALEEEVGKPLSWFGQRVKDSAVFAADGGDGRLCGMLGYRADGMVKRRHIGHLWGMYVRDEARGQGYGSALLAAAIAHARPRVAVLQLLVGAANPAALRLYEGAGFQTYGIERASLRVDGVDADTILMALEFDPA